MSCRQDDYFDHLEQLRRRILLCLLIAVAGMIVCFIHAGEIMQILQQPLHRLNLQLYALRPQAKLMAYMKAAFWGGLTGTLILTVPLMLSFLWPACHPKEKKLLGWGGTSALILFYTGCWLSWQFLTPTVFSWLADFASGDGIAQLWSVEAYLDLLLLFLLMTGVIFQLPWILLTIMAAGLIKTASLRRLRRHIILAAFIAGALFTPPDIYSQIFFGTVIIVLFEITLLTARILHIGR